MGKKLSLPIFARTSAVGVRTRASARPSVDVARAWLGGRVGELSLPPAGFAPGVVVTLPSDVEGRAFDSARVSGVILFASQDELHVLLEGDRLHRLRPTAVAAHEGGELALAIERIAADVRIFGQLAEGQAVRYADASGQLVSGKLIEKCRWGALVLRHDGGVVAVGFRKLWPASTGGAA